MENTAQNNSIEVCGRICTEPELSHRVYGESFYGFYIENSRLSGTVDTLPVIISERLITGDMPRIGQNTALRGQIRSYNSHDGLKTHLILSIFVKEIELLASTEGITNAVALNGYLCKAPVYRTTPFGREIADILLAVNRAYGKSDYIPAICWGRNAKYMSSLSVGDNIKINGRMQSREYQKHLENGDVITKTAYEVSVSRLEELF